MPGPDRKNPNLSLNDELFGGAYSGYSSDAKENLKVMYFAEPQQSP